MKRLILCLTALFLVGLGKARADYTYNTIYNPNGAFTRLVGISDTGEIVGQVFGSGPPVPGQGEPYNYSFLYQGGIFTNLNLPGNGVGAQGVENISNNGQYIVGYYTGRFGVVGFLISGGAFTTLSMPGFYEGVNDLGQTVGAYGGGNAGAQGFILNSNGDRTTLDVPGAANTEARAINDLGQVVGWYNNATGAYAFLYTNGTFTTVDVPGSSYTEIDDINDLGQIVGVYDNATGSHGFLYVNGSFTTLDVPGAADTAAYAINDAAQIVGIYDEQGIEYGFIATPVPEPASLALLGIGIALIGCCSWRRQRQGR